LKQQINDTGGKIMALNRSGKTEIATVLVWILIVGAIAYVADFGGFQSTVNGFLGKGSGAGSGSSAGAGTGGGTGTTQPLTDTKDCPTDGVTTYTVNVQDALSTTATSKYPEYFVFNGNQLIKEGTLSTTASTITLSCGKDYDVLLINTTAGNGNGLYPQVINLKARIAQQTINVKMYVIGEAVINSIYNPANGIGTDNAANLSLVAGATKNFKIQFNANYSQRAFNKPLILCHVNTTEIQTLTLSSFDDGKTPTVASVPKRITASTGRMYYAWEYPGMLDPTHDWVTAAGAITASSSFPSTVTAAQNMTCLLADQQMYKIAQYKTATSIDQAFKLGAENSETIGDVGAADSSTKLIALYQA
jgi:hypothetical protein